MIIRGTTAAYLVKLDNEICNQLKSDSEIVSCDLHTRITLYSIPFNIVYISMG